MLANGTSSTDGKRYVGQGRREEPARGLQSDDGLQLSTRREQCRIWCAISTYAVKNPHQNTGQITGWWARGDLNPHVLANTGT